MNKITRLLLAGTALAALAPAADARAEWYVGAFGGYNFTEDADTAAPLPLGRLESDNGYGIGANVGYAYGNGFRTEFELSYRQNDADRFLGGSANGELTYFSGMANVLYDFGIGSRFVPYVGLGLGVTNIEADGIQRAGFPQYSLNDDTTSLSGQLITGLSYHFDRGVVASVDYRLFDATLFGSETPNGLDDQDILNQSVFVGLRYHFLPPAPPPTPVLEQPAPVEPVVTPPPAEPAPAQNFLVFFDFDRATLTPEGRQVVAQAAEAAKSGQAARIEVVGHADRAGSDQYNLRLSQRRANTVKAELQRQGVGGDAIGVQARGESEPLVATADGVREPQNRRVEIVLGQ